MNAVTRRTIRTTLFGITLAMALAVGVLTGAGRVHAQPQDPGVQTLRALSQAFESIAEDASPAVVGIEVSRKFEGKDARFHQNMPLNDDLYEFFFGPRSRDFREQPNDDEQPGADANPNREFPMGQGSGIVVASDGYIMTNNHIVGKADRIHVTLKDGRELDAKLIGTDPMSDVALIKIEATGLPTVRLGDSDDLKVGEWVVAIGNPFGLSHTVTAGIVSAKGRSVNLMQQEDFIQTDAAINPGNSGGPLLNLDGEVIGLNTAILSRSGGYQGIGLAIPVNTAKPIADQLREFGKVTRGFLGVHLQAIDANMAAALGVEPNSGVLVGDVLKDTAAEEAGMKSGDIIVEYEGSPVIDPSHLSNRVGMSGVEKPVQVVVLRDGERVTIPVTLRERPEDLDSPSGPRGQQNLQTDLGLTVQNLTDDLAERLGLQDMQGVVVAEVDPGSPADRAGLQRGWLIQEVNRNPIHNVKEFKEIVDAAPEDAALLLLVHDGEYTRYLPLRKQ